MCGAVAEWRSSSLGACTLIIMAGEVIRSACLPGIHIKKRGIVSYRFVDGR